MDYLIGVNLIISDWCKVTPVRAAPDFNLFLYDPSGNLVASSEGTECQEDIKFFLTVTGTYTIKVYSYSGDVDYVLDVSN
ncbi:hypothetical protein BBF96_03640 [Anoxybacter fermentans]|uniref:Peptidase C-terminal archaeal/bacterial domain-containing protein n=1 Tax=Anoxybacter fermentans TaxID=1323375 RepID=A0A3Q9HQV4_9FIRM|nr:hypothetical protein BBF96_03640 [Anoxybacter fermentans]